MISRFFVCIKIEIGTKRNNNAKRDRSVDERFVALISDVNLGASILEFNMLML